MTMNLKKTTVISKGYIPSGKVVLTGFLLVDAFSVVAGNFSTLQAMVKRDLLSRFRGSVLGRAWIILLPVAMMLVYSSVFGLGMGVRFNGAQGMVGAALATWFSLVVWQFMAESINRCVSVLHDNAPFVKRIPFPVAILPTVMMVSALSNAAASFVLFALAFVLSGQHLYLGLLYVPLILLPVMLGLHGILWIVAAVGGIVRDLKHIVPVLLTLLMFATPVVWPLTIMPERLQYYLALNPLAWVFETMRNAVFGVAYPELSTLAVAFALGMSLHVAGYFIFRIAEKEMRDVV